MSETHDKLISAKEISQKFHIPYPTINHYTNLDFFSVVRRRGNVRFYHEHEVKLRLDKISRLKDEGYPLRLIIRKIREGG